MFEENPHAKCIVVWSDGPWYANYESTNVSPIADGTWWQDDSPDGGYGYNSGNWRILEWGSPAELKNVVTTMGGWKNCKFDRPFEYERYRTDMTIELTLTFNQNAKGEYSADEKALIELRDYLERLRTDTSVVDYESIVGRVKSRKV